MRLIHRLIRNLAFLGIIGRLVFPSPGLVWAEENSAEVKEELKEMRQTLQDLKRTIQSQNEVIEKQQRQIEGLESRVSRTPVERAAAPAPVPVPAFLSARPNSPPGQIGAVLPEIGVVGDIVATSSQKRDVGEGNDRVAARELELVLGNYVDPYSRLDATIAFSDFQNVDLEEAYLTRWGLPWDVKGRIGKFFPRIGKAAAGHRDVLETVDEPLVVRKFFGNEGFTRAGVDFTRPLDGPFGLVLEPSVGVLEGGAGEGAATFGSNLRRPTVYSHLKMFKEISDVSNFELGLTHLTGSKDNGAGFDLNVYGVDAIYAYYVTPINKLKLQSEFYLQDRGDRFSVNPDTGVKTGFDRHPWGSYLLAEYKFAPRWAAGVRADQVRLVDAVAARHEDQGISAFLTFFQSEFARWRLQFRHEEDANQKKDNAVFLQGTFAIGTHKHQLQ